MARHLISTAVLLIVAVSATAGFTLRNITHRDSPKGDQPHGRPVLYHAIVHLDGRPTQVLVDKLGEPENLKFQTGDPVATPYPFIGGFGSITWSNGRTSFSYWVHCTSSLIDSKTVLTAAHCVLNPTPKPDRQDIFVYGLSDLRVDGNNYWEKSKNFADVESVTPHPDYDHNTVTNDVAVAVLKDPLTSSQVQPICLGGTDEHNTDMMGAGWGMPTCFSSAKDTLRKAKSTLVDQQECKSRHWRQLLDQQICTLFETDDGTPAAAAPGDSGGPLFSLADPSNPVQVGIASFVRTMGKKGEPLENCVRSDVPQVYVRVTSFKTFINGIASSPQWC